ncbi:MAG: uracil-DNA glycosylase family protein [Patescibacteria group bacterium]
MQLKQLHKKFDILQSKFGARELNAIYGAGEVYMPQVCFVFMNPTARNVSAIKSWKGIRAPWLGTKNTWKLFTAIGVMSKKLNDEIQLKKSQDWDVDFSEKVYRELKKNKCFVTNLAKCTQSDASHLSNAVFEGYKDLMLKEIELLAPKVIIAFGNQVSSILLNKNINVSKYRKQSEVLDINGKEYKVYPVFYPVGQGMRNISKSIEDIRHILKR